jgi:cellulose synthase/poly-beta-1,6-N-acetylglucosamine synthase-like glycosyltransferase
MHCLTLAELPPLPPGRTCRLWTEDNRSLPDTMLGGSPWPRISIVTPSYNQRQFLKETIRSALMQGYPDLNTL